MGVDNPSERVQMDRELLRKLREIGKEVFLNRCRNLAPRIHGIVTGNQELIIATAAGQDEFLSQANGVPNTGRDEALVAEVCQDLVFYAPLNKRRVRVVKADWLFWVGYDHDDIMLHTEYPIQILGAPVDETSKRRGYSMYRLPNLVYEYAAKVLKETAPEDFETLMMVILVDSIKGALRGYRVARIFLRDLSLPIPKKGPIDPFEN
jgi:hypothetical protein